ncbi:MAG: hypothetical protein HA492_00045 [Candidatus Verstraetearchaeota archaeon]|nr:hypothetical protein [Candidatus Verstraetearchaeota archaeon]
MQYTVRVLIDPKGNEVKLDAICRIFSSMVRMAYNRLLEGKRPNEVVRLLQDRYSVSNWRWCQWAITHAQSVVRSQRELLPLYHEMYDEKIAHIKQKRTAWRILSRGRDMQRESRSLSGRKQRSKSTSLQEPCPESCSGRASYL